MKTDPTVVEAVFSALLAHFWKARGDDWPRQLDLYPRGYLISYGHLVEVSKVPIDPRNAGGPLFQIAAHCGDAGWPPLNSLVVRQQERFPGDGYFAAPGSRVISHDFVERMRVWASCAEQCIAFDDYPRQTPKAEWTY